MKKVLTALANPTLNNELRKYEKYDVIFEDLFYQEAVIEIIEKAAADILILSILLQGQWDIEEFVDKIKSKNKLLRIILIVDEISDEDKNILISKGIYDIYYDNEIEVSNIIDAIDREETIYNRALIVKEVEKDRYEIDKKEAVYINKIQKQEIITVSGTNGSGKSTIVANLSKVLAKRTDSKILVIDLDTLNGNIDEIYNINKIPQNVEIIIDEDKKCGLNYIVDLISKNRFDSNVFDELIVNSSGVDIITGNTSLHFCQNVLNEECYNKILECAKEKYDFILIDTSSNIFLDSTKWAMQKANRIIFATENNYLCAKKANQLLNIYINTWGVWKNKIQIVINKSQGENLEKELMKKILGDLGMIGNIKLKEQENEIYYEEILQNINYIPKRRLIDKINIFKNKVLSDNWNRIGVTYDTRIDSNINIKTREIGVSHAN